MQEDFFRMKDDYLLPQPIQKSYAVVVNAGTLPAGSGFSNRPIYTLGLPS
jgi:hypothetical protein